MERMGKRQSGHLPDQASDTYVAPATYACSDVVTHVSFHAAATDAPGSSLGSHRVAWHECGTFGFVASYDDSVAASSATAVIYGTRDGIRATGRDEN